MNHKISYLKEVAETVCDRTGNDPEGDMVVCAGDLLILINVVETALKVFPERTPQQLDRLRVALGPIIKGCP